MITAILGAIAALSFLGLVIVSSANAKPRDPRVVALFVSGFMISIGILVLRRFVVLYLADQGPGIGKFDPPVPLSEHLIYGPLSMSVLALIGLAATGIGVYVLVIALIRKRN